MPCSCVVGLQWGDVAKGKIVDLLTGDHDFVVRYNGGANAGHTVVSDGKTFKLSLLPTGVLRKEVTSVIGNGVVVYPPRFAEEADNLRKAGVEVGGNLVVSNHAHVIFPYHMEEERLHEEAAGGRAVGTTNATASPPSSSARTASSAPSLLRRGSSTPTCCSTSTAATARGCGRTSARRRRCCSTG
jgi:adenylosuccinate synthase